MRIIGFVQDGIRSVGVLEDGHVRTLGTTADFYANPDAVMAAPSGPVYPLAELTQVPFVPETARVFCVGINYLSHAEEAEAEGIARPKFPMIFGRWEQSLVVDGAPVPVPPNEQGLDWEAELAVVIKDRTWHVSETEARKHVLGYTAFNDLSARRKQMETRQFTLGKNADRSGPIGPVLVTSDEVANPGNLRVSCKVNGEVVQDSSTRLMIHTVEQIIAYITDTVTLLPGDVIATGTPSGVGAAMSPPRYLRPGDVTAVTVENIGTITTPIVDRAQLAD
ncbi:fumarylacetoacetate hydrolase family protein [Streptomyces chartreusis]|uniref:fumarylacetoacetate hydrolase family protein n=1 Tax=Streptomyces chartreusis TaxID=1969 RepID=UPI0036A44601